MSKQSDNESVLYPPAHPLTGRLLWDKLCRALAAERGYEMTLEKTARILGKAVSTTDSWLHITKQPQVLGFVCLLERLSEEDRLRFIRGVCRTLPSLLHPRLAHDQRIIGDLLMLLRRPQGLTLIRGAKESRNFLFWALAHTLPQIDSDRRTAAGLDTNPPDRFVPVETMVYLRSPLAPERLRQAVQEVWPAIAKSTAPILFFNEVWSSLPEIRDELLQLAKERHVVLADSVTPDPSQSFQLGIAPFIVLNVWQARENSNRIQITCQGF